MLERMCTQRHQLDVITGQRLSKQRWADKVDEMVGYGAQGAASDIRTLVDYLAASFGPELSRASHATAAVNQTSERGAAESAVPAAGTSSIVAADELTLTSKYDHKSEGWLSSAIHSIPGRRMTIFSRAVNELPVSKENRETDEFLPHQSGPSFDPG